MDIVKYFVDYFFDNLASGSLRVSIGIAESFRVVVVKEEERLTFKEKYIVFIF